MRMVESLFGSNEATNTVFFTSPETFGSRTLEVKSAIDKDGESRDVWVSKMKDRFDLVMLDEGHRSRNSETQFWASMKRLKAKVVFIKTATPMISSWSDILGQLLLLWREELHTSLPDDAKQ